MVLTTTEIALAEGQAPPKTATKAAEAYQDPHAAQAPWWLSPDAEHAHTACPLRPFAHMVVALGDTGSGAAVEPPVATGRLAAAAVVHMSDALRRKMPRGAVTVGDMVALNDAPAARMRAVGAGLWHMLGWLVGTAPRSSRARDARRASDDPLLVGNEGLGAVEVAGGRGARRSSIYALCAHTLSPTGQAAWRQWQTARGGAVGTGVLAVVHVAEVTTLQRAACCGVDSLVPPPLPLERHYAALDACRTLGPPPPLPEMPPAPMPSASAPVRWLSLLVSRHGLVEMAYPLRRTCVATDDTELDAGPAAALASSLGESLFARVHPEDVVRVIKALRLAWDARPDVYHFARLRREWQRRRLAATSADRAVASAPSTPPLRASADRGSRQVYAADGIEVANGVAALTVQLQLAPAPVDWADADSVAEHARFARMRLVRWPPVVKPPRAGHDDPADGFILVAARPLPEPARARSCSARSSVPPPDRKKRSISSVASTATLVGTASSSTPASDAVELARLCRSASSLSCHETTARPSVELVSPSRPDLPWPAPTPMARPVVGLTSSAVHTATAMSPHLSMRQRQRRANIPVGSHPGAGADELAARVFGG
ncbi:hypothetical protein LPJ78_005612 [Coemansia sp. RSA 989]|nr:hypothetical protein BX667DRAFT_509635 [Coemansia mojavensis]KAJ1738480.1 hypothetical protein LPJ68_005517 [Coemansia sp. RSA 1086]KAJ1746919.1 hypothetical protein LPJ79_005604 [Coemansia sp. RSA 1821]KAJ1860947.1 hypothetical protein LPJ78_005612 [Coemansia sp. RSA 989]KAJ1869010.1 hypothetical protein LPJ55_005648 [Coemansia sp. RSA 990]KAJ2629607.1 hypothetical protein H4R22_003222 [Coemansia sp. RSA 1290]KAJ2649313.1 hypothetical protein IWW40_003301 [Coemansia sp. RSA 1250]KAJ26720